MDREIIIPRKKSTTAAASAGMLFATLLFGFIAFEYFCGPVLASSKPPLLLAIFDIPCVPICAFCFICYFKDLFNNTPVLIVNEYGIQENITRRSVGIIKWEDIHDINFIPYMDNTYWICIILKNPEDYILNKKLVTALNKRSSVKKWGHIRFTSLYFKKEFSSVIELMKYYFSKYQDKNDAIVQ
ncbi:MAG: hypothetical protein E7634_01180 [Ruminococcaceae bacterium]|nr:hypothetical protein [Oscillospiraceae bacterium]